MTDNTFKQNTFVLKEDGKIVWIEKMPEVPSLLDCQNIHFGKPDSDSGRMLQKLAYKQAVQSAIANGIEVSNQIHVKDHINPFGAIGEIEVNKPYTLNCRVEIKQQEVPCPDGIEGCMVLHSRAVAHVTFPEDKPEQKRVTFDEQPERTHSIRCASYTSEGLRKRGHIAGKCDCQPEAAGQEQETAEAFLKALKPQVADFDKHDKVAKVFDYYDMTGFAAQYASQQTAFLQKEVDKWKGVARFENEECIKKADRINELHGEISSLQKQVEELREENERLKKYVKPVSIYIDHYPEETITNVYEAKEIKLAYGGDIENVITAIRKALNPQDNAKEAHS
jgi:hypothetical protein